MKKNLQGKIFSKSQISLLKWQSSLLSLQQREQIFIIADFFCCLCFFFKCMFSKVFTFFLVFSFTGSIFAFYDCFPTNCKKIRFQIWNTFRNRSNKRYRKFFNAWNLKIKIVKNKKHKIFINITKIIGYCWRV